MYQDILAAVCKKLPLLLYGWFGMPTHNETESKMTHSKITRPRFFLPMLILLCLFYGCATVGDKPEKPADELIKDGMEAYNKDEYKKALDSFMQLKDWYPFSKYAILAELKIADSHYYLQQYPEAVAAYEEFERMHPRNEAVPYIIYQIGLCYFEQIDTIDRDQTPAQKALDTFQRLMLQYPGDGYALKARSHLVKCFQNLSGHEFYVGYFYYQQADYKAARHRFINMMKKYPDVGYHHQAMQYIAECEAYEAVEPHEE